MSDWFFEFFENVICFNPYLTEDGRWIVCASMKGVRTFRSKHGRKYITCTEVIFDSNDYESRDTASVRASEYNRIAEFIKCAMNADDTWNNIHGESVATEDGCATVE